MTKEIKEYKKHLAALMADETADKKKAAEDLLIRIKFYSHERLIHLIVTMSFAVLFMISLILICVKVYFAALSLLLLVLLIPYIAHYYFLENSVQQLYRIYYTLVEDDSKTEAKKQSLESFC